MRAQLAGTPVVEIDVDEHVRNLDAVGAHVLHGRGAGAARDSGQALQPAEPHADRRRDEGVPVLTGLHGDEHGAVGQRFDRVPGTAHQQRDARHALVRDHDVRAAAEQEQRFARGVRGTHGFDDLRRRPRHQEPARRAAHPQRGVRGERSGQDG